MSSSDSATNESTGFWAYLGYPVQTATEESSQSAPDGSLGVGGAGQAVADNENERVVHFAESPPPPGRVGGGVATPSAEKQRVKGLGFVDLVEHLLFSHEPPGNSRSFNSSEWSERQSIYSERSDDELSLVDAGESLAVVEWENVHYFANAIHEQLSKRYEAEAMYMESGMRRSVVQILEENALMEDEVKMALAEISRAGCCISLEDSLEGRHSGIHRANFGSLMALNMRNIDQFNHINNTMGSSAQYSAPRLTIMDIEQLTEASKTPRTSVSASSVTPRPSASAAGHGASRSGSGFVATSSDTSDAERSGESEPSSPHLKPRPKLSEQQQHHSRATVNSTTSRCTFHKHVVPPLMLDSLRAASSTTTH